MKIRSLEIYLTNPKNTSSLSSPVFHKDSEVNIHIGNPTSAEFIVNILDLERKVIFSKSLLCKCTKYGNRRPGENGLGLPVSLIISLASISEIQVNAVYLLALTDHQGKMLFVIPFFVIDLHKKARIAYIYPSNTINAYSFTNQLNCYSKNHHQKFLLPRASFLRTQNGKNYIDEFLPGFQWLMSLGESVRYLSDFEFEAIDNLDGIKLIIIGGHSEYWTLKARLNLDTLIASGVNILIMSGNTMWWNVRHVLNEAEQTMEIYRTLETDPLASKQPHNATVLCEEIGLSPLKTIGADFNCGGYPMARKLPIKEYPNDYIFLSKESSALTQMIQEIKIPLGNAIELDGMPVIGSDSFGFIPNEELLNAYCVNILGVIPGYRNGFTLGTTHYFQKSADGGAVFQIGAISAFSYPIIHSASYLDLINVSCLALLENHLDIFKPSNSRRNVEINYMTPNKKISNSIKNFIFS